MSSFHVDEKYPDVCNVGREQTALSKTISCITVFFYFVMFSFVYHPCMKGKKGGWNFSGKKFIIIIIRGVFIKNK